MKKLNPSDFELRANQKSAADDDDSGKQKLCGHSSLLDELLLNANLLNNEEAAAYIGITPGTLEVWRCTKRYKIAYTKVGRLVRYKKASLDAFLESRTVDA